MKKGKGFFITAEGLDGSGKTTQVRLIQDYLICKGHNTFVVREPGGTAISESIRKLILDPANVEMSPVVEMLLYAASRAQLVEQVIRPALERGEVVICDRFFDSSIAYQGFGRGLEVSMIADVNRTALRGLAPDLTFFFDLPPQASLARRSQAEGGSSGNEDSAGSGNSGLDRIEREKLDFHGRVYNGYKWLAANSPDRIRVIDAASDEAAVFEKVKEWLDLYIDGIGGILR